MVLTSNTALDLLLKGYLLYRSPALYSDKAQQVTNYSEIIDSLVNTLDTYNIEFVRTTFYIYVI